MHPGTGPRVTRPPCGEGVLRLLAAGVARARRDLSTFGVATPEPFSVIKGHADTDGKFTFFSRSRLGGIPEGSGRSVGVLVKLIRAVGALECFP